MHGWILELNDLRAPSAVSFVHVHHVEDSEKRDKTWIYEHIFSHQTLYSYTGFFYDKEQ